MKRQKEIKEDIIFNNKADKKQDLHTVFNDQDWGVTDKDRENKIKDNRFYAFVSILMAINIVFCMVFLYGEEAAFSYYLYFLIALIIVLQRICVRCYLIQKWKDYKIDPTYIESRI